MHLFDFTLQLPVTDPIWIFFLMLTIILFAPLLLERLRIPHIIGMVLAGVVIGKYGFNILERDSSFQLFGEVGLYYIMFLAGVGMDMVDFKKNRRRAILFGLLTFIIPMLLGLWSSFYLLNFGVVTSVLLASMYASHTLIAYPTISRYGLTRLRSVSIAIGGTAVTISLALLVLAVVAGMFKGEVDDLFWLFTAIKVSIACFLIIFLFPRIARWFFRAYDDNVMQFVFVLAMVFFGGGILQLAGLEGILGAFLVGLVLNRLIPQVSPLMNHLKFVGNALFIPYFLIGVGMLVNIQSLFNGGEALKVAVVMTIIATVGKWLAAWITQKICKMDSDERRLIFGLSNAQAAATLAAVLIGHEVIMQNGERLLNDDVFNGTVIMILFTCICSAFVTEKVANKISLKRKSIDELGKNNSEENILIAISNPDSVANLINMALLLKVPKCKSGLTALNVRKASEDITSQQSQGTKYLENAAMITAAADVSMQTITKFAESASMGIIEAAKENNVTEILVGLHHKNSLVDSFFGKVIENLLKGTHRQVLISRCVMPANTLRRIVVAVPPKAEQEVGFAKWLERIGRIANQLGCRVHFFCHSVTQDRINTFVENNFKGLRIEFSELQDWDNFLDVADQVNFDHLLVVVTARRGSVSYAPSFERLPAQLSKHFSKTSLLVLYPDQYGDINETVNNVETRGQNETFTYDKMGQWFNKWFKKN